MTVGEPERTVCMHQHSHNPPQVSRHIICEPEDELWQAHMLHMHSLKVTRDAQLRAQLHVACSAMPARVLIHIKASNDYLHTRHQAQLVVRKREDRQLWCMTCEVLCGVVMRCSSCQAMLPQLPRSIYTKLTKQVPPGCVMCLGFEWVCI
jgi:hypothetical protein